MKIKLPYGKGFQEAEIEDQRVKAVLEASLEEYKPEDDELTIVKKAMENPIGSKKLSEIAAGKDKVVILISDHTRP